MNIDKKRPRQLPKVRIHIENGRFHILGLGGWYSYWRDPYYLLLTVPWQGFFVITIGVYALANALAAVLFLLGGEGTIINAQPGSFADAFFFSVQTSASIGYGVMSPGTPYAHLLVSLEAIVSLIGIAVLTGLAYARFSRPTAQVLFSKVAVVSSFKSTPTLMFRAANERRNQIVEAQMRLYLTLDEFSEGKMMRRFYELEMLRDRNPSFFLTWTALHPIDANSPLYGLSKDDLYRTSAAILVSVSGIDQTVAQAIHTRHTYYAADILWDHQFKDIIHAVDTAENQSPDQSIRYIDFSDFHEVEPIAGHEVEPIAGHAVESTVGYAVEQQIGQEIEQQAESEIEG
ncbi:MAG: ion channel [Cyanobacteria bacterium J06621_3]